MVGTILGKCPCCGCDIMVTDTTLSAQDDFLANNWSVRIETQIKHASPITEEGCAEFFQALAREQAQITSRVLQRQTENMEEELAKNSRPVMRRDSHT